VFGLEPLSSRQTEVTALAQPLVGRTRHVVALAQLGSDSLLADQLHHRLPVIGPQPQDLIHTIELSQRFGTLVAVVADDLADDGPVLLFDLCRFRDYADEEGCGRLRGQKWSA
jgi:hypothetical protein